MTFTLAWVKLIFGLIVDLPSVALKVLGVVMHSSRYGKQSS
jgi:hypothetical protein